MINEWMGHAPESPARLLVRIDQAVEGLLYAIEHPRLTPALYRAAPGDSRGAIAAALLAQLSGWKEWQTSLISGGGAPLTGIRFTGRVPGGAPIWRGITVRTPPSSFVQQVQEGRLPVPQTILITLPATTTGGTWSLTLDWGTGPETASGLAANITPAALAAAVDALATPTALGGGATAELVSSSPRQYRLRLAGGLAIGVNATASADGAALLGNATVNVSRVQSTGGNAPAVYWLTGRYYVGESVSQSGLRVTIGGTHHDVHVFPGQNLQQAAWWNARLPAPVSGFAVEDYGDLGDIGLRAFALSFAVPSGVSISVTPIAMEGAWEVQAAAISRLQDHQGATSDEFQFVTTGSSARTLTFDGQTTASHATNVNLKTLLEDLSNVEVDDVAVLTGHVLQHWPGLWDSPALVQFQNGLGAADQPQLVPSGAVDVTTVNDGSGPVNEIHRVAITAEGGTFTARVPINDYDPTAAIDYLETAGNVATAIEATLTEGETVDVSGAGTPSNPYLIEYTGDLAQTTIPLIVIDGSSLTGGKPVDTSTQFGAQPGVNEIQRIRIDPHAVDGTLRSAFRGAWSGDVEHDADSTAWQSALQGLATIGDGNALVDGSPGLLLVEFVGALGWQPLPLLQLDQEGLVVAESSSISLQISDYGSGLADYRTPANWTLGHVPNTGETIVFGSGRAPCLYGLLQRSTFRVEAPGTTLAIDDCDLVYDQIVRLRTTGTFPAAEDAEETPIVIDDATDYHVVGIDHAHRTLLLSTTADGPPIRWTSAGTGTHTVEVQAAALVQYGRYSGTIGLPRRNSDGVYEWLPRYLAIGLLPPQGTSDNLVIGQGPGNQSPGLRLDLRGCHVRGLVMQTGNAQDVPPLLLLLDHPDAELHVVDGEVGIALEPAESSRLGRLNSYGGRTLLGNALVGTLGNFNSGIEFIRGSATDDQIRTER